MGSVYAAGIAETDLSLEQKIEWDLRGNFYPPIPSEMVPVCVRAVEKFNRGDTQSRVRLPKGITFAGKSLAPVTSVIYQHRLDAFLEVDDYYYED